MIFDDFIMLQLNVIRNISFYYSKRWIYACTRNELIHCKQMHVKKENKNYIVDQNLGDGVRIRCATLDDGTRTFRGLFYLFIRGEN